MSVWRVLETIGPLFLVISFGHLLKRRGFIDDQFVRQVNRFVFLFPLPPLIFTGIVKSKTSDVQGLHLLIIVVPTLAVFGLALAGGRAARLREGRLGSFVQTTFHGNLSYIGLAVLFYMLGEEGLRKGSILLGFLILLNNTLAVAVLSWSSHQRRNLLALLVSILKTPVVVAAFVGIVFLFLHLRLPDVLLSSMSMVANIALPMALILIGASISPENVGASFRLSASSSVLKLLVLPGLAVLFCKTLSLSSAEALPAILLLATPAAASSYTMAREMGGDSQVASSAVTLSTVLSPITFVMWASVLS
jgi:malate permease and related proteins